MASTFRRGGRGIPSGTAEQRAYYGASRTPSGTPRDGRGQGRGRASRGSSVIQKPGEGGAAAFRAAQERRRAESIKKFGTRSVEYRLAAEKLADPTRRGLVSPEVATAIRAAEKAEAIKKRQETETLQEARARMGLRDIEELRGVPSRPRQDILRRQELARQKIRLEAVRPTDIMEKVARQKAIEEKIPIRVTKPIPRPEPTAKVFVGTDIDVEPRFKEVPISKLPLGYARPEPSLISPTEITRVQELRQKAIRKLTPPIYQLGAGVVAVPVGIVKDPIGAIKSMVSPKAWMETGKEIFGGLRAGRPRTMGNVVGMVLTAKAISKLGGKLSGLRKGDVIVEARPKTIAVQRGGVTYHLTETQVSAIKRGLIRDIKKTGTIRIGGKTIKVDKPIRITELTPQELIDIIATQGDKYVSKFKYESIFGGKTTRGVGGELAVKLPKRRYAGISVIKELKKPKEVVTKFFGKTTKPKEIPMRVTPAGRVLSPSLFYRTSALAREISKQRKIAGIKGEVLFFRDTTRPITKIVSKRLKLKEARPFVAPEVIEKITKEVAFPKPAYPKGVRVSATGLVIGREGIEELTKMRKPELVTFIPEEVPIYKPREEFIEGIGVGQVELIKQQIKQTTSTIQQQKQQLKQIPKEAVMLKQAAQQKLALLQQQKVLQREAQKQALKQLQQLKQVQAQITPTMITPTITPAVPFPFITTSKPKVLISAIKKIKKKVKGFDLFVKSEGAFKFLGTFPKAKAKKLGAKIVRETLSAQFKLLPSKKLVKPSLEYFEPSPEIFREFRIVKGKKIKTPLQFIQRRGKRLSSRKEVSEIQRARNNANLFGTSRSRLKWF
jgi:hypothetical protein